MQIFNTTVAFVIPALNEERNLHNTLTTIKKLFGSCESVVISDNGSTDRTIEIAEGFGALTTIHPGVSISALRNEGVKLTNAEIIVFLDSDIQLDDSWPNEFKFVINKMKSNPLMVTGSRYSAINKSNYVGRYWYNKLSNVQNSNYINSGHLLVTRRLFELIDGFDENRRTGEDYDFCQRALQAGGKIEPEPKLIAWHDGYPDTVKGFMEREMWHGRAEFKSFNSFVKSKVAIASTAYTASTISAIVLSLSMTTLLPISIYFVVWVPLITLMTIKKFGKTDINTIFNSFFLYCLYLFSRSFAWTFKARRPKARS